QTAAVAMASYSSDSVLGHNRDNVYLGDRDVYSEEMLDTLQDRRRQSQ
ncbi:hypothetical protein CBR_g72381, partial [Chara braunii]